MSECVLWPYLVGGELDRRHIPAEFRARRSPLLRFPAAQGEIDYHRQRFAIGRNLIEAYVSPALNTSSALDLADAIVSYALRAEELLDCVAEPDEETDRREIRSAPTRKRDTDDVEIGDPHRRP